MMLRTDGWSLETMTGPTGFIRLAIPVVVFLKPMETILRYPHTIAPIQVRNSVFYTIRFQAHPGHIE